MTQMDLAALVGTRQPAIARFESGRAGAPGLAFLERMAEGLGLRVAIALDPGRDA